MAEEEIYHCAFDRMVECNKTCEWYDENYNVCVIWLIARNLKKITKGE